MRVVLVGSVLLFGCGPTSADDAGESTTDGSTSAPAETSGTTPAEDSVVPETTSPPPPESTSSSSTGESTSTGDDADGSEVSDEGPKLDLAVCEFEPYYEDAAMNAGMPHVDCGFVVLDDDVAAWQAAHDCALGAFDTYEPFTVAWQPATIDSLVYSGLATVLGEFTYDVIQIRFDDYQGDVSVRRYACDDVVVVEGCEVAVGEICLECENAGKYEVLCD